MLQLFTVSGTIIFEDDVMIFDRIVPAKFNTGNVVPYVDPGGDITAWFIGGQAASRQIIP